MPTCYSRSIVLGYEEEEAVLAEAAVGRKEVMQNRDCFLVRFGIHARL